VQPFFFLCPGVGDFQRNFGIGQISENFQLGIHQRTRGVTFQSRTEGSNVSPPASKTEPSLAEGFLLTITQEQSTFSAAQQSFAGDWLWPGLPIHGRASKLTVDPDRCAHP